MEYPALDSLLLAMVEYQASDMYLTVGYPPCLRLPDRILHLRTTALTDEEIAEFIGDVLDEDKRDEFHATLEYNTAISWRDTSRFRINIFRQQHHDGLVIRRIQTDIPTVESLGLPPTYADLSLMRRGLILVVGPTGSGKSTSTAAMIGHRNRNGAGHIITIEDPIEFVHQHDGCIITQRDVGLDTFSYGMALKNALRQRPDVVLIGEIRDRETMEHAINFAETGHLCLATLHANNANQAVERILNFFPEEKHPQVLMNLSLNLRAILSQRLVLSKQDARCLAVEVMLNNGLIKTLIEEGKIKDIKEMIERGNDEGMITFDQSLFGLYEQGIISEDIAIHEADNPSNVRLRIRQLHMSKRLTAADMKQEF